MNRRRNDHRNIGAAFRGAHTVHCLPDLAGKTDACPQTRRGLTIIQTITEKENEKDIDSRPVRTDNRLRHI